MTVDFHLLSHPGIQSLIPYKPGKSIEELKQEKGLTDIIKMASNENPLGCSPLALSAIQNIASSTVATYPSPIIHPLMQKLADTLHVDKKQLFLSNGSDYLFGILLNCFALHVGKHILTHEYAFSTYEIQAKTLQIPVSKVPVHPNWQVNVNNIIQACTPQTGLIFLANPNNPTGLLLSQRDIKFLLERIPENTLVVLDEAYYEFAESEMECNSIDWITEHPNLVVTRTFSKIYGMAGLRLGYAIAHQDIISILQRVQLPFAVNQIAMAAAYAALDDSEFIKLSIEVNQKGMHQLKEGFDKLGINYLPSACNFLTIDCTEDSMALFNYLLANGIIVRPLHPYNMSHYLRVSIGTKEHNTRFLDALKNYYQ